MSDGKDFRSRLEFTDWRLRVSDCGRFIEGLCLHRIARSHRLGLA